MSFGSFSIRTTKRLAAMGAAAAAGLAGAGAMARDALAAKAEPWQLGLPEPVTPLAEQMRVFHDLWLLPIITVITIFVLALLLYTCWRFSEKRNPTPSKTTHNSLLEVVWTGVPVLILVVLAFPSLQLLYASDDTADTEMTLKVVGHQWYWEYQYVDENFGFDAFLAARTHEEAEELGVPRLMMTDNVVVLPSDTKILLQFTSADVLHNWALSDFGVRVDTVPGRLNEAWTKINAGKEGMYYGFCSELCGADHAFMPIAVQVVTKDEYRAWVQEAKQEFAALDPSLEEGGASEGGEITAAEAAQDAAGEGPLRVAADDRR